MTALRLGVNALFYLPGDVGGSETYLRETLRALARRPERPHLVLFSNAENDRLLRAEFPEAEIVETGIAAIPHARPQHHLGAVRARAAEDRADAV